MTRLAGTEPWSMTATVLSRGWLFVVFLGGGTVAAVLVFSLIVLLVFKLKPASKPTLRARMESLAAWARAGGHRYTLYDTTVAGQFSGPPFVHEVPSYANFRAWLTARGRAVEVMEYQYRVPEQRGWYMAPSQFSPGLHPGYTVRRGQVVIVADATTTLPPEAHRQLAVELRLQDITLREERGALIGWRDGDLTGESLGHQIALMLDYLDRW
jgi:hypothetical protein